MLDFLLTYIYISQKVRVKWSNCLSKQVDVSNGVKQGGILSAIVYMDVILTRLKKSGIGCHIGNIFCGAIGYADDVSLLCPSLSSLRMLLNITDVFGKEFNVDFNPNKYQLLVYRNNDESVYGIYHNNSFVRAQQYGNHLGNIIGSNVGTKDVSHVVDNLCIACNALLNTFPMLSGKAK